MTAPTHLGVGVEQVFLCAFVAGAVPVDGAVRLRVQLLAQRVCQGRGPKCVTLAVDIAHGQVHLRCRSPWVWLVDALLADAPVLSLVQIWFQG